MTSRDEQILKAAFDLFARYGIGRTTMADIAQAAGVARQTLYNTFPNKDEVLRAVIRSSVKSEIRSVKIAWATMPDLASKMDLFLKQGPIAWYDLMESNPDATELFDGINNVAKVEVTEGMNQWTAMFGALFKEAGASDPEALADMFVHASKTAKYDVLDRAMLLRRLETLKHATLLAISN